MNESLTATWASPPPGVIKINVDDHIVAGSHVSLGAVFRDNCGTTSRINAICCAGIAAVLLIRSNIAHEKKR